MKALCISIAGKSYGLGNYKRTEALVDSFHSANIDTKHFILTDTGLKNLKEHEYIFFIDPRDTEKVLSLIDEESNIIVCDLYGEWATEQPIKIYNLYRELLSTFPSKKICGIDDIRYLDIILNLKGLYSFISNAFEQKTLIRNESKFHLGNFYHIYSQVIANRVNDRLKNKNRDGIVVAISSFDQNYGTEEIITILSKLHLPWRISVFLSKDVNLNRKNKIQLLCQENKFQYFDHSDLFFDELCKARALICGEGTSKYDALALGANALIFSQFESQSAPLNNFLALKGTFFLGCKSTTSMSDISKNISKALNNYSDLDPINCNSGAKNIVDLLLKQ